MTAKQTLHFSIIIDAPRKIVWECMFAPDTYREWTAAFAEGSHYEGSWEQGQRIYFLAPGGGGMIGEIAESRPYEYLSIRLLGFVQDGVEDTGSENVRSWAPAYKNYRFDEAGPFTELKVEQDMLADYVDMMNDKWPRALLKLKEICEARTGNAIG